MGTARLGKLRLVKAGLGKAPSELLALRREVEDLRHVMTAMEWERSRLRYHAFDAIRDDGCPCCGARVSVEDNGHGSGIKLKAVA